MKQAFYEACRDITDSQYLAFDKQNECPYHFHGQVAFLIINKGRYSVTVNGKTEELSEGEIAFADSFDDYSITALRPESLSSLVTVPNRYLDPFKAHKNGRSFSDNFIKNPAAARPFRHLMEIMRVSDPKNSYLFAGLYEALLGLLEQAVPLESTQHTRDRDFMRRVLSFIREHLTENITLASVAASVGYSENYFSALFHRCFHTNFRTYLGRMRVNFAAYLIKQGTPILSAAMDSGFNSLATFYRVYQREYGTTPSQIAEK